jgi:hypothetical protein
MKQHTLLSLGALVITAMLVLVSCQKEDEGGDVLPTNLVSNVTVNAGTVSVTATADNAHYYSFTFSENGTPTTVENEAGSASYTYTGSGSYNIIVRAHKNASEFIFTSQTVQVEISIEIGEDGLPVNGYSTPSEYAGYTLVWADEFDGDALSDDWVYDIGTGNWGWGNNEEQYYRPANTEVSNGSLKITAEEGWYNGSDYTSSRLKTQGRQSFQYGRIDIRANLPKGQGIWPALWMLGDNIVTNTWPACGEIDIMEMVGSSTGTGNATVHGTAHWDEGGHNYNGSSSILSGGIYADEWHVFSIIWDEAQIRWFRDDIQYHQIDITSPNMSEFHQPFYFILNVAVGGLWPGSPDATTEFPQTMAVDYVRVFQPD